MITIARHYESGSWIRVEQDGPTIAEVAAVEGPSLESDDDDWIAPAFWDIQVNGRWGISFSDPSLTVEQVAEVVRAQAALGTARLCPTLITAPSEHTRHGVRTIAAACERYRDIAAMVLGIHLEGPHISPLDGYRGAHRIDAVRDPDWDEFRTLQAASGGRINLVTLAPERPGAIEFIRRLTDSGVVVALGHTAADGPTIRAAADAGARLSTHLGNGIAATLPRHPNTIWEQAAEDRLFASVIADGHHLDSATLRVLARAKGPDKLVLVSDASPLAGLPPGRYGDWEVDPSGRIVVAGTPYLAGSSSGLDVGSETLLAATDGSVPSVLNAATLNPARLLRREVPEIVTGRPSNLIRYRRGRGRFRIVETFVDGVRFDPGPPSSESVSVSPESH